MDKQVLIQAIPEIITQLLGFLIVFLVLKKFAFGAILDLLDERRKTIETTFSDLEKQKKGLETLEKEYRQRIEKIEDEARGKMLDAAQQGMTLAKEVQDRARQDAQKMIERAKSDIDQEIAKARLSLRDEIVQLSSMISEKAIKEKLDTASHKRLVDEFVREMEKA